MKKFLFEAILWMREVTRGKMKELKQMEKEETIEAMSEPEYFADLLLKTGKLLFLALLLFFLLLCLFVSCSISFLISPILRIFWEEEKKVTVAASEIKPEIKPKEERPRRPSVIYMGTTSMAGFNFDEEENGK